MANRPLCSTIFDQVDVHDVTEFAVLMAVAAHTDQRGRGGFPSVTRIAAKLCCSRRTVQRTLRRLESRGVLIGTRIPGRSTSYDINLEGASPVSHASPASHMTPVSRGGVTRVIGGASPVSPKEPEKSQEETKSSDVVSSLAVGETRARPASLEATRDALDPPCAEPEPEPEWTDEDEERSREKLAAQRAALGISAGDMEDAAAKVLGPTCAECGGRSDTCRCGWPEPEPEPEGEPDAWKGQHDYHGDGSVPDDGPTYTGEPDPDTQGHML